MARKKIQSKAGRRNAGSPGWRSALDLRFDRASTVPLYRQVYDRLRDLISRGGFGAGARLPSSRSLASQLSLSRATVAYAYDLLAGDGYVGGRGSAGTYVSAQAAAGAARVTAHPVEALPAGEGAQPSPLSIGMPALDQFPRKTWARLEKRRAGALGAADLLAPDPQGYLPLRQALANRLAITRGIICDPAQIFVTNGYAGALLLAATSLLASKGAVWVEDPGDPDSRALLDSLGARVVGVPVDGQGMDVREGVRRAPAARLALVTPCHAPPLGRVLAPVRRDALLAWAGRAGSWILEHDRDNDFHYAGPPPLPLKSRDPADRVIYAASFGSVLFPGLRLGCAVVPKALLGRFLAVAAALGHAPAVREQAVLREFIRRGFIGQHVNRMRRLYAARRRALLSALVAQRVRGVEVPEGGLHLILRLRGGRGDTEAAARAAKEGLGAEALSSFSITARQSPALLLGFSALPQEAAEPVVRRLLRAIYG